MWNKLIKIFYWQAKKLQVHLLGTRIAEQSWRKQNFMQVKKVFSIKQSLYHSHRKFLIKKISQLQPLKNILEIGCGNGPNLFWLSKKLPQANLVGIDINNSFIKTGREWLNKKNIKNIKLMVNKADNLDKFNNKSFDVVFTDAVLIYIGPDKIQQVIRQFIRLAKKAVIFLEWHDIKDQYYFGHWIRNYNNLIKKIAPKSQIRITKINPKIWPDKNWQKFGYLIEVLI